MKAMTANASSTIQVRATEAEPRPAHVEARCVVSEYLHDWGLHDPVLLAAESKRIVEQAVAILSASGTAFTEQELCAKAVRLTVDEIEAWIRALASNSKRSPDNAYTFQGPIDSTDLARHRNRLPAKMLLALEQSVSPVVPTTSWRDMRAQPRTRLWRVLRKGYWRKAQRRLQTVCQHCGRLIQQARTSP
jgi:hypothetical protein